MIRHLVAVATITLVIAAAAEPALAAINVPKPIQSMDGGTVTRGRKPADAPPSAVPGARAEPELVAPAERLPTDMPPTEALFDSINRGDAVAAREAIGRGADIHGHNVLGLTPLEQSVDLGRNDISFLLLSLRGGAGYSTVDGPGAASADAGKPTNSRAERRAAAQDAARERREQLAQSRAARSTAGPVPSRNARLFAGDGGAPVPQSGFLGFDSAR